MNSKTFDGIIFPLKKVENCIAPMGVHSIPAKSRSAINS